MVTVGTFEHEVLGGYKIVDVRAVFAERTDIAPGAPRTSQEWQKA